MYDEWLATDWRREAAESCSEGSHQLGRRDGVCIHCGFEDDGFDPDARHDREREDRDDRE